MRNNHQITTSTITPQQSGTTPSMKRSGMKYQMHSSRLPTPTNTNINAGMNVDAMVNAIISLRSSLVSAFAMAYHVRTPPVAHSSAMAVKVMAKTSFGSDIKIR